jgi:hypothetical protein
MMRSITWLACVLFVAGTPLAHAASDTSKSTAVESKAAAPAAGQPADARKETRSKWESMTPEQRAEARKRSKSKWESMTPEQKAEAKKRHAEQRKQMESVATKETKEKSAAKPAADLPPPSAGPR